MMIADIVLIVALILMALMMAYFVFQVLLIRHKRKKQREADVEAGKLYKDIKRRYGL